MNQQNFKAFCDATYAECSKLLGLKGQEYSSDLDRLANFKKAAEALGVHPLVAWAIYYKKHVDAQFSFVQRVTRAMVRADVNFDAATKSLCLSEPIEGRFHDAINYCLLGAALIAEAQEVEKYKVEDLK